MAGPSAYRISPHTGALALMLLFTCGLLIIRVVDYVHPGWLALPFGLYAIICGFSAATVQSNFFLRSIHRGKIPGAIALTFDDGPHNTVSAKVLDVLREQKVPAAFFLIGKNAAAEPDLVRRMVREGHLVGNHSYHHSFLFDLESAAAMAREILETDETIRSITGKKPLLFRPPYGVTNPMLAKALQQSGHYSIGWSLRSLDTRINSPEKLLQRVLPRLSDGDILLLHDHIPNTAQTLTALIEGARSRGFTFVSLDSLIPVQPYA